MPGDSEYDLDYRMIPLLRMLWQRGKRTGLDVNLRDDILIPITYFFSEYDPRMTRKCGVKAPPGVAFLAPSLSETRNEHSSLNFAFSKSKQFTSTLGHVGVSESSKASFCKWSLVM